MSGLTPNHAYMVNGRIHLPASRSYLETLVNGQALLRLRNSKGGLYITLDADELRDLAKQATAIADHLESGAAALADAAIKKALGNGGA